MSAHCFGKIANELQKVKDEKQKVQKDIGNFLQRERKNQERLKLLEDKYKKIEKDQGKVQKDFKLFTI